MPLGLPYFGGLGLSRWLGIDDSVTGVWVGGLILSLSFWLSRWLEEKYKLKTKFKYLEISVIVGMYLLTLVPLFWAGIIGHPINKILGIDKLLFGTIVGSGAFLLGLYADKKQRQMKGKQFFNFQKVVFPVVSLVIFSLIIYYFGGYLYRLQ